MSSTLAERMKMMPRAKLMAERDRLITEIALASEQRAGLQRAIDSRKTTLARLEAQLVMTSPASQTAPSFAR